VGYQVTDSLLQDLNFSILTQQYFAGKTIYLCEAAVLIL
jgi:hypothetical protein